MARRDIVVVGASAGGVEALKALVSQLPSSFPAAVFIVLHVPPHSTSRLHVILSGVSRIPVKAAKDGAVIEPGHIYVAVPDHHLALGNEVMRVTRGPKENRTRPAADVLFRSAAYAYGPRVIGVVLSGALDDGTAGLWEIKDRGGMAMVQSPQDAMHASMPENALTHVAVDYSVPASELGALIAGLVGEDVVTSKTDPPAESMATETGIALGNDALYASSLELGKPAPLACPECHGAMVEIEEGSIRRYRCHTGHAYSEQTLYSHLEEKIDEYLWNALRALDERVLLLRQRADAAQIAGAYQRAATLRGEIDKAEHLRRTLRQSVLASDGQSIHHNGSGSVGP
jgi:two-component system chemotaxis response regulator CheB